MGLHFLRVGIFILAGCFSATGWAQDPFDTPVAIVHVTATLEAGSTIDDATILIDGGRIIAVGADVEIPSEAQIFDGSGLYAYPGFIDAATHLGIKDKKPSDAVLARASDDEYPVVQGPRTHMQLANRLGVWPHIGVTEMYTADADAMDSFRKLGFSTVLITPHADVISGSGEVIQLSGKPLRRSTLARRVTQILGFGDFEGIDYSKGRTYPASPMGAVAMIRQTYMDAEWYRERHALSEQHPTEIRRVDFDPVLDAMGVLLDREQMWTFAVDTPNEIHHALDLALEFDQRIAILGGKEAWKVADRLAAENVPVIVSMDFEEKPKLAPKKLKEKKVYTTVSWTPEFENDFFEPLTVRRDRVRVWEEQVNNLHALIQAGVEVAITGGDLKSPDKLTKNIEAALELDLTADELLNSLTQSPASILGLGEQLGSLAPGKIANVTLLTKPLGEKDSQVRHVFIDGTRFNYTTDAKKDESIADAAKSEIEGDRKSVV